MSKPCAIQKQIENSNEIIADLRERIRKMERRLTDPQMPEERRKEIETEITEIKKMLETNEEMLHKLHRENSKSFAVAACLFFVCFLVYGIYVLIVGS
ncbi:AAEL001369-PA [Aedes aegypti]|uniref:Coiled-coil domain-containing protein 167 n=1 Tax=Aedes aegypti TaxID=7159 RepID=Q17DD0_AEDAE|nr:AAEL004250-PA [Aedes aegypti]EAT47514.1 AAEL001369-PA [Aedes aegypti]